MVNKVIRDVIHGYIKINEIDLKIIDTPTFQRLKRIRQGTFNCVYPCANHTRFEHSLGVMHLGEKVIHVLRDQNKGLLNKNIEDTIRYACLLHDVGHAPLSHLGEIHFERDGIGEKIVDSITNISGSCTLTSEDICGAPHEKYSCAVSLDKFGKDLYDIGVDLELFCRMIIGSQYRVRTKGNLKNCIIQILNGPIDVDKFDYLLRDSQSSGAKLFSIDIDRLISAYKINRDKLVMSSKALSTITNLVYGRESCYEWVVNHHTNVYHDCIYKRYINKIFETDPERKSFFSYSSIANNLVDDYDLIQLMREYKDKNDYFKSLYSQIFDRNKLVALWKSQYAFDKTIRREADKIELKRQIGERFTGDTDRELIKMENEFIKKSKRDLHLHEGEFFIGLANTKIYTPSDNKEIYLEMDGENIPYHSIFETSQRREKIMNIPYIFYKENEEKTRREKIIKIIEKQNGRLIP